MTAKEFGLACDAYSERLKDQQWMSAWHACNIINAMGGIWVGKKHTTIHPGHLMGTRVSMKNPNKLMNEDR